MEVTSYPRDEFLARLAERHRLTDTIEVPEWGGTIHVRRLSIQDVEDFAQLTADGAKPTPATVRTIILCLADADGNQLLTPEDAEHLMKAEAVVVMRVFSQVAKLNGMSAPAVEEAVRDFSEAQDGDTSSG